MNQLTKTFEGHDIRVVGEGEKVMFVASDVAKALGYKRPNDAINQHCKGATVKHRIVDSLNRTQEMRVIRESDVYRLVTNSQLPAAEEFEMWVMEDVLPSIRKHGAYMTPEKIEEVLLNPDTIIQLAQNLKAEQEKRVEAERIIAEQQPLVEFANTIANDKRGILIRDFAKVISKQGLVIGEKRLFQWMRTNGYLMRNNRPYQRYIDMGVLELVERPVVRTAGTEISFTPKITGKGQEYFYSKLREEFRAVSV